MRNRVVVALVIIGLLAGLASWARTRTGAPSPVVVHVGDPVTDDEQLQVAEAFADAVNAEDFDAFDQLLDWDVFVEQILADAGFSAVDYQALARRLKDDPTRRDWFQRLFQERIAAGGECRLLRLRADGDTKRPLFRLLDRDSGYAYYELLLARRPDGGVRVVDVYLWWYAERLTEQMRRMVLPFAQPASQNRLAKLLGLQPELVRHYPTVQQMDKANRAGEYAEVLRLFRTLPAGLQKDKNLLFLRLDAAASVGTEEYLEVAQEVRAHYPDDPCLLVIDVEYFRGRNHTPKALAAVDRLEAALGGDPHLHVVRADTCLDAGAFDDARRHVARALAEEPDLVHAHWTQINIAVAEKKYDEVVQMLTAVEAQFGDFGDLKELPHYADFVASPQYEHWLKSRPKK